MTTYWKLNTKGNPLARLRKFLADVWAVTHLDGFLAPIQEENTGEVVLALLENPAELIHVNPFMPLMLENTARLIPKMVKSNPSRRLGVFLRPCEMRALVEMTKHNGFGYGQILTFCIDCLGTYTQADYGWRVAKRTNPEKVAEDALKFARQGGISTYRYRPTCQMCLSQSAQGADFNISVLGLPARQFLMVYPGSKTAGKTLQIIAVTDGPAEPNLVATYERSRVKTIARRHDQYTRVVEGLSPNLPENPEEIAQLLSGCFDCQECLNACPICSIDFPSFSPEGLYSAQDIRRWLISCACCGMCEENCPNYLPLSAIFRRVMERLSATYHYAPAQSVHDPLPVA